MIGKDLKTLEQELRRMERYQELTRMGQENRETNPWANAMHQDVQDSNSPTNNKNNNNNNPSRRHASELVRSSETLPTPPDTPPQSSSCPPPPSPPAYTPPPTAQARARARLGYVGAKSALPNTISPWAEGTAGTDIDDIDRPAQDRPRPPPYVFHARDRFLETGLPATFDTSSHTSSPYPYPSSSPSACGHGPYTARSHPKSAALFGGATTTATSDDNNRSAEATITTTTTPRAPSTAYGVARRVALYSNITTPATPTTGKRKSNNRDIWGGRRRRSFRSTRTVDYMLDLERGNPVHKETDVKKYATAVFLAIVVILIFSCTVVYFTPKG